MSAVAIKMCSTARCEDYKFPSMPNSSRVWRRAFAKPISTNLLQSRVAAEAIDMGVHYTWYHTYRPVGPKINDQLALSPDQITKVRRFVTDIRAEMPIAIVDAYYDHDGKALCPMATGISHHIGPGRS